MNTEEKSKLINIRPFGVAALFCAIGILTSYFCAAISVFIFPSVCAAFVCACVITLIKCKNKNAARTCVIISAAFLCLGFTAMEIVKSGNLNAENISGEYTFEGKIQSYKKTESGFRVYFSDCIYSGKQMSGNVIADFYSGQFNASPEQGEIYLFSAQIGNSYYNYDKKVNITLLIKRVNYYARATSKPLIIGIERNIFEKAAYGIKCFLKGQSDENSYPIELALMLGDTGAIPEEKLANYRFSGIAHVFAVSGLHIGVCAMVMSYIAKKLRLKSLKKIIFVIVPLFLYTGICGFRSSAVRAFIMSAFMLITAERGVKNDRLSSAYAAAALILCVNPTELFDVGFQLSFAAAITIMALAPPFRRYFCGLKKLGGAVSVSLAAQLGTLPILTGISGYMSVITLFTNLLFVPIIVVVYQILIICSLIGSVALLAFGSAAVIMIVPEALINILDSFINQINFAIFAVPASAFGILALVYYAGLFFASDLINIKPVQKAIIALSATAITILGLVFA